jgi:hypothetical protein
VYGINVQNILEPSATLQMYYVIKHPDDMLDYRLIYDTIQSINLHQQHRPTDDVSHLISVPPGFPGLS